MQANKQLVVKTLRLMAIYSLALMVVLAIVRTAFAIMFVPWQTLTDNVGSMPKVLFNALRFDLQVVAYCALLPTLWMLAAPLLPATKRMAEAMRKSFRAYYMVAGGLLALLGIIDLGYYSNFNQHISLTFFDEGPADLVVAIWQDYPIIWIVLLLLVVELLFWGLDRRVARPLIAQENRPGIGKSVGLVVVWLVFLTICLRGSVWRFPLQVEDIVVSPEDRINAIVPNAPYMLKKAMKEKSEAFRMRSTKALLSDYKFASLQEALDVYTDHKVQLSADTLSALERALYAEAPRTNSGHQKPNVVVLCCESWSNFLLNFDTPEADLLCGMGKHLKEDICFRNFQSVRNATIATIENLTVGTPYPRLFRSRYRTMRLPSSLAQPFLDNGYTCEFVSGMDKAWENCGEALERQGFSKITSKYEILHAQPKASANSIGVYDEYMLAEILKRLNTPAQKPQMIFGMTTTNHPPFELPDGVRLPPLPDKFLEQPCFNKVGHDVLLKYLRAFQYFNQSLCRFLDEFKRSDAAHNTILVLTGDHNVRAILDQNHIDPRWHHSVPLYIYLPPRLRTADYPQQIEGWGCHYDILPTIAPLALNGTRYLSLGRNLLAETSADSTYSYNEDMTLCQSAYRKQADRKAAARELLLYVYFQKIFTREDHGNNKRAL